MDDNCDAADVGVEGWCEIGRSRAAKGVNGIVLHDVFGIVIIEETVDGVTIEVGFSGEENVDWF